jgi:hypothetical protein
VIGTVVGADVGVAEVGGTVDVDCDVFVFDTDVGAAVRID